MAEKMVSTFIDFDGTWFANISGSVFKKSFQSDYEYNVVFKASQWIIDLEDDFDKLEKEEELQVYYGGEF